MKEIILIILISITGLLTGLLTMKEIILIILISITGLLTVLWLIGWYFFLLEMCKDPDEEIKDLYK